MSSAPMVFELRKPKKTESGKKYPALFLLHGKGSNEKNMFDFVGGLEEHFFIFSIRGHIPEPPGFAFFTFQVYGQPDREGFDQGIRLLTDFIDFSLDHFPLDQDHLYFLGFSQGAVISNTLALALGKKIRGIVSLSGYIPKFVMEEYDIQPVDHLSAFISHGEKDPVLPYEWGIFSQKYFNEKGADVYFHTYQEGHTVSLQNRHDFKQWLLDDCQK